MAVEGGPKFDLLGAALSIEFNECSIAASELKDQVREALNGMGTEQKTLYAIGDGNALGQEFTVKDLGWYTELDEGRFDYALIKPADSRPGRRRIMRRAIENSIDVAGSEPRLVAILGDEDAYVTLGMSVNNGTGNCPYFVFGDDMRNPFATTADENTPRMATIELVRDIIAGNKAGGMKSKPDLPL